MAKKRRASPHPIDRPNQAVLRPARSAQPTAAFILMKLGRIGEPNPTTMQGMLPRWPLSILVCVFFLAGCPGELANPECFPDQEAPRCTIPSFDPEQLMAERCGTSGCHVAEVATETNNVDLISPGLYDRLTGQMGTHPACADFPVIDRQNWRNSYLMRKLQGDQGPCGDTMPFSGLLPEPELQCVARWLVLGGGEVDVTAGGVCTPAADAGGVRDTGTMDARAPADTGPADTGGALDGSTDSGDDAGMADPCAPLRDAGFSVCVSGADACEVKSEPEVTCMAMCAMVGLTCQRSVDDNPDACEAQDGGTEWACADEGHMHDYCYCGGS